MKIEEKHIFEFKGEWKPMNYNHPPKEGRYMTIRCGLGGIYTMLNEYKDGKWLVEALDNSKTIAYSVETISDEEVERWYKFLLKNDRAKRQIY